MSARCLWTQLAYERSVQKADIARLARLALFGGIYADLDTWPCSLRGQRLERTVLGPQLLTLVESPKGYPSNFFIASPRGHSFLDFALRRAPHALQKAVRKFQRRSASGEWVNKWTKGQPPPEITIASTGPWFLSETWRAYLESEPSCRATREATTKIYTFEEWTRNVAVHRWATTWQESVTPSLERLRSGHKGTPFRYFNESIVCANVPPAERTALSSSAGATTTAPTAAPSTGPKDVASRGSVVRQLLTRPQGGQGSGRPIENLFPGLEPCASWPAPSTSEAATTTAVSASGLGVKPPTLEKSDAPRASLLVLKMPCSGSTWLSDLLRSSPRGWFVHQAITMVNQGNAPMERIDAPAAWRDELRWRYVTLAMTAPVKPASCYASLYAGAPHAHDATAAAATAQRMRLLCESRELREAQRQPKRLLFSGLSINPGQLFCDVQPRHWAGLAALRQPSWRLAVLVRHNLVKQVVSCFVKRETHLSADRAGVACTARGTVVKARHAACDVGAIHLNATLVSAHAWKVRRLYTLFYEVAARVRWPTLTISYEGLQLDANGTLARVARCLHLPPALFHAPAAPFAKNESLALRVANYVEMLDAFASPTHEPDTLRRRCLAAMLASARPEHFPDCLPDPTLGGALPMADCGESEQSAHFD